MKLFLDSADTATWKLPASLATWSQDPLTHIAMDQFDRDTVASKRLN